MHTLNVPSYNKYWPEDGLIKLKHVAKTIYYWLYIDVVLWLNKILYKSPVFCTGHWGLDSGAKGLTLWSHANILWESLRIRFCIIISMICTGCAVSHMDHTDMSTNYMNVWKLHSIGSNTKFGTNASLYFKMPNWKTMVTFQPWPICKDVRNMV